jgi:hypothetical protein
VSKHRAKFFLAMGELASTTILAVSTREKKGDTKKVRD